MVRRLFFALTILMILAPWTQAGLISFLHITQSGQGPGDPPEPYGPPSISGNTLSFLGPGAFAAASANGVFDIQDSFTDGLVTFSVVADPNTWISGLSIRETGLRSLIELISESGTAATTVRVIAAGRIFVTELDHGDTALTSPAADPIDIGFDVTWNLVDHLGAVFWDEDDFQDIEAILAERGVEFELGATALDFVMNNQLIATSEEGTLAFIDKKRIDINVDTEMIPEPITVVLAISSMGLVILSTSAARKL